MIPQINVPHGISNLELWRSHRTFHTHGGLPVERVVRPFEYLSYVRSLSVSAKHRNALTQQQTVIVLHTIAAQGNFK